ncbi:MAG: LysM peptidoglycan-binding domain-containing protein [Anaerolineae bacterium]|nr:LysM peptidoglycan-binding domain-containing protein [Anaerolineae bacterium]
MICRVLFLMLLIVVGAGGFSTPASVMSQDAAPGVTIHVVQRGENLYRIALQYGLTVDEIAQYNGIVDPTNIQVGQRLLIPLASSAAAALPTTHVVQPGETLRSIAELYGLTVDQLVALNAIANADTIYVGQVLNLVPGQPAMAPTIPVEAAPVVSPESQTLIYVVEPGDTLFKIATRFGLTVNDLASANEISDPTVVYAGQRLLIPGVEPPQITVDLPPNVTSFTLSPLILVEGETGEFRLTTAVPMTITGQFLGRDIRDATPDGGLTHVILVGVPVFTEAGSYPIQLTLTDSIISQQIVLDVSVQVLAGGYGNENITLLAGRDNLLDPSLDADEKAFIEGIMSGFMPTRYFNGPMGLPAAASITSPFGRKRSYNGGPRTFFHSGTDFAGAPGTPVMASAPGVIVFADTLNVRGKATIIDHGWGVYTGYWHQTEQFVSAGDVVTVGQVIGTIGATGRVTGPHLHWEVWVNGVPVNPMQWVKQSFS